MKYTTSGRYTWTIQKTLTHFKVTRTDCDMSFSFPTKGYTLNMVETCLERIDYAFAWGKLAMISEESDELYSQLAQLDYQPN